MKKRISVLIACSLVALLAVMLMPAFGQAAGGVTINYGNKTLAQWQSGNYSDVWDLTKGDLKLSYTVDLSEITTAGWTPVQVGLREVGAPNIDPDLKGGWMDSKYKFGGSNPTKLNNNDMNILMKHGWQYDKYDVTATDPYNLVTPFWYGINFCFWFDRDGVDQWQATQWDMIDEVTYNTGGVYDIVINYHALDDNTATMFATVNGYAQGFYKVNNVSQPPDIYPVGRSFTGNMKKMQVFTGRGGGGGTAVLQAITATGVVVPKIVWNNPADIVYGTPLGDAQLNATAVAGGSSVDGTFTYDPPAGTVLDVSTHALHVDFVPDDPASYTSASKDVTINVTQKPASVTPDPKGKIYGEADPELTGTLEGFLEADGVTATYSREAGETAGAYLISAVLAPESVLANYDIIYNTADFTIGKADTATTVTSSCNPVCWIWGLFGKKVTFTARVSPVAPGAGVPDGTVTFYKTVCGKKTALGTATLDASGKATLSVPIKNLCLLKNGITAEYSGSGNFSGSTSPVLTQWVL